MGTRKDTNLNIRSMGVGNIFHWISFLRTTSLNCMGSRIIPSDVLSYEDWPAAHLGYFDHKVQLLV